MAAKKTIGIEGPSDHDLINKLLEAIDRLQQLVPPGRVDYLIDGKSIEVTKKGRRIIRKIARSGYLCR